MKRFLSILLLLGTATVILTGCSNKGTNESNNIDLDLSELSSMLVYSQVVNILDEPMGYVEKTIKINGQYYASYFESTKQYYHYIVVGDETLCCQSGIEFVWKGEHAYPDDYPENKTDIQLVGVFGSYEELGRTYYSLTVDDIVIVNKQMSS